jgi:hypothetical protein
VRGEARKIDVKRLIRDEKGQALVLVLILLLVGGLISGPLLSYMGAGLNTGQVYERRTDELYAADAGVEDAVWKIQNSDGYLPCSPSSPPRAYNITDVNGKSVEVTITSEYSVEDITFTYRVVSTASADGGGTEIEAYIVGVNPYGDYGGLLGNVITSLGEIETYGKVNIDPPEGEENGPVANYGGDWPPAEELAGYYLGQVEGVDSYDEDTLDVKDYAEIGPFYRDGAFDNKGIINTGATSLTLQLNGTAYITGDTEIGTTGQEEFILDLNGQTLFVESDTVKYALRVGGKCSIKGPGVIVAVGSIYFAPKGDAGCEGGPVFILSVEGETYLQPSGDFYGSVAGNVTVAVKSGTGEQNITYPSEGFDDYDLNFLIGVQTLIFHIASWEVTPLSREELGE